MPHWGRPPGARLGRDRSGAYGAHQSWNDGERFQEIDGTDEDLYGSVRGDLRRAYMERRFHSDELLFDGLDYNAQHMRRGHSEGRYYDDSEFEAEEPYFHRDQDYSLQREDGHQSVKSEREAELVASALERIARARALGKMNIKLSQAEIDALDRFERSKQQQRPAKITATPKNAPASKKSIMPKAIESAKKKQVASPRTRPVAGRVRNPSDVSTRSTREDDLVNYQIPQEPDYDYVGRPHSGSRSSRHGSPRQPRSRTNSSQNIRQPPGPIFAPYYPSPSRYVSMPEGPYHRRMESTSSRYSRFDSGEAPDVAHYPRSRSNSNMNLRSYPLEQLPNPMHASRAPRFDPSDPRYASPSRRVVSGSSAPMHRRPQDELFMPNDPEVMSYLAPSSRSNSDSDGSFHDHQSSHHFHGQDDDRGREPVTAVPPGPGSKRALSVKSRSAAAATTTSAKKTPKSGAKATRRR